MPENRNSTTDADNLSTSDEQMNNYWYLTAKNHNSFDFEKWTAGQRREYPLTCSGRKYRQGGKRVKTGDVVIGYNHPTKQIVVILKVNETNGEKIDFEMVERLRPPIPFKINYPWVLCNIDKLDESNIKIINQILQKSAYQSTILIPNKKLRDFLCLTDEEIKQSKLVLNIGWGKPWKPAIDSWKECPDPSLISWSYAGFSKNRKKRLFKSAGQLAFGFVRFGDRSEHKWLFVTAGTITAVPPKDFSDKSFPGNGVHCKFKVLSKFKHLFDRLIVRIDKGRVEGFVYNLETYLDKAEVLEILDSPYAGYRYKRHVSLEEANEEASIVERPLPEDFTVFIENEGKTSKRKPGKTTVSRVGVHVDYQKINKDKAELGNAGEELVYNYLCQKYGRENVEFTSHDPKLGDGLGYDLKLKKPDGTSLLIEVKTKRDICVDGFDLSINEQKVSMENPSNYQVWSVHKYDPINATASIKIYNAPFDIDHYDLEPLKYKAYEKKKVEIKNLSLDK